MLPVELKLVVGPDGTMNTIQIELTDGFVSSGGRVLFSCTVPGGLSANTTKTISFDVPLTFCEVTGYRVSKPLAGPDVASDDAFFLAENFFTIDDELVSFDRVANTLITAETAKEHQYSGTEPYQERCAFITVFLMALDTEEFELSEALARADEFSEKLGVDTRVLLSDEFGSLNAGFWVVYTGVFLNESEADAEADRLRRLGHPDAYAREVGSS